MEGTHRFLEIKMVENLYKIQIIEVIKLLLDQLMFCTWQIYIEGLHCVKVVSLLH